MSWRGFGDRIRASFFQLKAQLPGRKLDNAWLGAAVAAAEDPPRAEPYSAGTVSHWLTGRYAPDLATWEALARVFGHVLEDGSPDPGPLAFDLPSRRAGGLTPAAVPVQLPPALPLERPPGLEASRRAVGDDPKRKRPR